MLVLATIFTTELVAVLAALATVIALGVCVIVSNNEKVQLSIAALMATLLGGVVGGGFATLAADKSGESAANQVKTQVSDQVNQLTTP